jgi:hypothetical protein
MEDLMRKHCLPLFMAIAIIGIALVVSQPAHAQTPSLADTMRIHDAIGDVGDTVTVEFYIRNVDTLGAYGIRLRFDPSLIEPLTDTVIDGGETIIYVEPVLLRGTAFEQFGGAVLADPGVMTFAAFDIDQDPSEFFLPGTGVAMEMPWRVKPSATPQTTTIVFENDPVFPQSFNTVTDLWGVIFKRPVLITGIFTVSGEACDCPFQGDSDLDGFATVLDLGDLIDILFAGRPDVQEPLCLSPRFDLDCDGFTTALDLSRMTEHLFAGGSPACDPCAQP